MAKKKLLESIVDFIDKPAKEIKKIKRKKQFDKRMKDLKSKDQKSIKSKEKRDEFFSDKAITKRRKEREDQTKAYAARMEKEFAKSSKISPRKMKGGGIAIKGHGKTFIGKR